jgi:hypothetical protein
VSLILIIEVRDYPSCDAAQFIVSDFLVVELVPELSLVILGYGSKFDHNMRFGRRVHGGPTRTEVTVAVEMYECVVLLLGTAGLGTSTSASSIG